MNPVLNSVINSDRSPDEETPLGEGAPPPLLEVIGAGGPAGVKRSSVEMISAPPAAGVGVVGVVNGDLMRAWTEGVVDDPSFEKNTAPAPLSAVSLKSKRSLKL